MIRLKLFGCFFLTLILASLVPFVSQSKAATYSTGFETGWDGWGKHLFNRGTDYKHNGSYGVYQEQGVDPAGDENNPYNVFMIYHQFDFRQTSYVNLTLWAKVIGAGANPGMEDHCVVLMIWDENNDSLLAWKNIGNLTYDPETWVEINYEVDEAVGYNCTLFITGYYDNRWYGGVAIDDVELDYFPASVDIDVPEPGEPGGLSADGWMFAEHKYYTFTANITFGSNQTLDTLKYYFLDGAEHNVSWCYNYGDDEDKTLGQSEKYITVGHNATCTISNQSYIVKISIWLKWEIIDCFDADLRYWVNDTDGDASGWLVGAANFCHIYSRGGLETLDRSGPAGRLTGGESFCVFANNDSYAKSTLYYRNLVHARMMLTLYWEHGNPPDEFPNVRWYFGYEYFANGAWVPDGFNIILALNSFAFGADYQYVNYTVFLYSDNATEIQNGQLFGFYNSHTSEFRVYVDLWINKANASSVFGARALSYYYAMKNNADIWVRWLTGNNWGIMFSNASIAQFFGEIKDINGSRVYGEDIELCRLWTKVKSFSSEFDYLAKTIRVDVWNLQFDDRMMGIASPPFEEQKIPSMPQGGFLGVLATWFERLKLAVGTGVMDYWLVFVGWIDTIFTWAGWPDGFTQIIYWISSFGSWITNSFSWLITLLTSFFALAATFIGKMLNTLASIFSNWASMFGMFFDLIEGAYGVGIDLWANLGLVNWVTLFAVVIYPMYLFALWDTEGLDAVINHLLMMKDILAFIITTLLTVIQIFLRLVGRIIESIPVVE